MIFCNNGLVITVLLGFVILDSEARIFHYAPINITNCDGGNANTIHSEYCKIDNVVVSNCRTNDSTVCVLGLGTLFGFKFDMISSDVIFDTRVEVELIPSKGQPGERRKIEHHYACERRTKLRCLPFYKIRMHSRRYHFNSPNLFVAVDGSDSVGNFSAQVSVVDRTKPIHRCCFAFDVEVWTWEDIIL